MIQEKCDVEVKHQVIDDEKGKYTVVLKGVSSDLVDVQIKLTANTPEILQTFARLAKFGFKLGNATQTTLRP